MVDRKCDFIIFNLEKDRSHVALLKQTVQQIHKRKPVFYDEREKVV